ncbi:hypothetical protein CEXT_705461 [Caerostris extrusa]|uniref:Uncharacterized protein n=1 Tax=Caerostris extrusa TaxID=172846 RepID=A0AAV4Q7D4_CAEEX|nr:hypothetical protein CEXT_705461 [Caerostris extrusa]
MSFTKIRQLPQSGRHSTFCKLKPFVPEENRPPNCSFKNVNRPSTNEGGIEGEVSWNSLIASDLVRAPARKVARLNRWQFRMPWNCFH